MNKHKVIIILLEAILILYPIALYSWPIPDSGQTKCYDDEKEIPCPSPGEDYYGQDGNYIINPRSYTKLDENGNELPDDATQWAMVRDNVTGFIWEVKTSRDGIADYGNPHDIDNVYTWYDSNPNNNGGDAGVLNDGKNTEEFIMRMNTSKFGGFSSWRLPTLKELTSIHVINEDALFDNKFFPNLLSEYPYYWTSRTCSYDNGRGWCTSLQVCSPFTLPKNRKLNVRAVYSDTFRSHRRLVDNNDGTITDVNTGLMWQQHIKEKLTWKNSLKYCEKLKSSGYSDWRLPSINELISMADYNSNNYYYIIDSSFLFTTSFHNTSTILSVEISTLSSIKSISAVVMPPSYIMPEISDEMQAPETGLPVVALVYSQNSEKYEYLYKNFSEAGIYRIIFYVMTIDKRVTLSSPTFITVMDGNLQTGDINADGQLDMKDLMLLLQILSAMNTNAPPINCIDIDHDGNMELEDAIYLMKILSQEVI